VLVLVTDGQVGNEDQLLQLLGQRLQGVRVFALGIDQAVNAAFLTRLAQFGGGACELVESDLRLDEVLAGVQRHLGTPLLTGLRLSAKGVQIDEDTVVPARLPDLFAAAPLVIHGRYRGVPEGNVLLEGRDAAGRSWWESVPGRISASEAIPSLWARGHIRDLEDRRATGRGDPAALERRIIETSLRWSVLSRFTAFVAVDRDEVIKQSGKAHKVTQAVEMPAGWEMLERKLEVPVAEFELSVRACNRKKKPNIKTLGDLTRVTEFELALDDEGQSIPADAAEVSATILPPLVPPALGSGEPDVLSKLREHIEKHLPSGPDMVTMGKLPQTPRVKQALEAAVEEARALGHDFVDTEHLLLGLLRVPEGVAYQTLVNLGLTLEAVREEVRKAVGPGKDAGAAWATMRSVYERFSERARQVMQLANQEAQRLNHQYIGTEHVLLALVREGTGLAAQILSRAQAALPGAASEPGVDRRESFWK
jgi:hypothetical protein